MAAHRKTVPVHWRHSTTRQDAPTERHVTLKYGVNSPRCADASRAVRNTRSLRTPLVARPAHLAVRALMPPTSDCFHAKHVLYGYIDDAAAVR